MKRVKTTPAAALYFLNATELHLLDSVLQRFPFTDHTPARITRRGRDAAAVDREKLLNQSLVEHRRELKRQAQSLLAAEKLQPWKKGQLLTLTPDEREILLQILNDIRIGCWHALGEPELLEMQTEVVSDQEFAWRNLMHLAGYFENELLEEAEPET